MSSDVRKLAGPGVAVASFDVFVLGRLAHVLYSFVSPTYVHANWHL